MSTHPDSVIVLPFDQLSPPVSRHGVALEILGHGAEHLMSSTIFSDTPARSSERDAARLLLRLSREVFNEYAALAIRPS